MSNGTPTTTGKAHVVTSCMCNCPLYRTEMNVMQCGHPDQVHHPYIISQYDLQRHGIPKQCPLRKHAFVQTIRVLPEKMLVTNKRRRGNEASQ